MKRLVTFLALSVLTASSFDTAFAQWVPDGKLVCAQQSCYPGAAISDGAGGAIIAWTDSRNGFTDIFVRRIDASGNALWTTDGVAVCAAVLGQGEPVMVSDGAGGAIVAWQDPRNASSFDIYVQRVNATGAAVWTANGVALCTATGEQVAAKVVSDGSGGAIVVWQDGRSGSSWDIYARRINAAGTPQWTANGVAVCTAASGQVNPFLVEDGAGGAIVTWDDGRLVGNTDIYAQRLNAAGTAQWTANGIAACAAAFDQSGPRITSDGASGAIITWYDYRNGSHDIYAQRVNAAGVPVWLPDGVAICTEPTASQVSPRIVSDGVGGAIVAWEDDRNHVFYDPDVYAQRVTGGGVPLWTLDGVALTTASEDQTQIALVSDGAQGAIAVWVDWRPGIVEDIYARRIDANGVPLWNGDGSPVCTAVNGQSSMVATSDGNGGVIAAWADGRAGAALLFAQRLDGRYGYWGRPEPTIGSAIDNPSDQGGKVIVRWTASQLDRYSSPGISNYSLWRSTDVVAYTAAQGAPAMKAILDPRAVTRNFSGAAVWKEITASGPAYWEWVANLDATYQAKYSYTAPTRQDSTVANPATTYFKVLAHEYPYTQSRVWESASASARSVDNLAPAAPLLLTIQQAGSNAVLNWKPVDSTDLARYTLYRAGSSGVQVIPINFLTDATLPNYTDVGAAAGGFHYIVTATDIHHNESAPSNEVSLSASTGGGGTPPITALTVLQNSPNPFSTTAEFALGLPRDAEVTMEIFDVAGRVVASRSMGAMEKGWGKVTLEARDNAGQQLPSGVYFYRVKAAGETLTRKMVIAR